MNLTALSIEKRAITYFGILLVVVGGIFSFFQLGQLEDPEFSVKTAVITTTYPGAGAEQVELEITDRIETKLQEMESFLQAEFPKPKRTICYRSYQIY